MRTLKTLALVAMLFTLPSCALGGTLFPSRTAEHYQEQVNEMNARRIENGLEPISAEERLDRAARGPNYILAGSLVYRYHPKLRYAR